MTAPSAFSGHLEKWIFKQHKDSIFFIKISPKDEVAIETQMVLLGKKYSDEDKEDKYCTGFVIGQDKNRLKILTCAHSMDHVFEVSHPISVAAANEMFDTYVLCDHYEMSFRRSGQNTHNERVYTPGKIIAMSCAKDLLLIQVDKAAVMNLGTICQDSHPSLSLDPNPPEQFDECVMISWPPLQYRTAVKGSVSHCSRKLYEISSTNPDQYNMDLVQVDIASDKGSSGAPLLSSGGRVIGVLHGGDGGRFSFFTSLGDIKFFMTRARGADLTQVILGNLPSAVNLE